jgi:hypothetical protein
MQESLLLLGHGDGIVAQNQAPFVARYIEMFFHLNPLANVRGMSNQDRLTWRRT